MHDPVTLGFSACLVLLSLALLAWHWSAWRKIDHGGLAQRDQEFFRRQFRRRTLISGMVGVIGLMIACSLWIEETWAQATFWVGVLMALVWMVLLAMMDWWSSRTFYGRDQAVHAAAIEVLKAEVRKYESEKTQSPPHDS